MLHNPRAVTQLVTATVKIKMARYLSIPPQHLPHFMRDVSSLLCLPISLTTPTQPQPKCQPASPPGLKDNQPSNLPFINPPSLPLNLLSAACFVPKLPSANVHVRNRPFPLYLPCLCRCHFHCLVNKETIEMEDLLCDEVWVSSTAPPSPDDDDHHNHDHDHEFAFYTTKEDSEQALVVCLEKELSYMPEPGYLDYLHSHNLVFARLRAVQWLIKTCSRLNLSVGTVFSAANYLDRFLSMSQCHVWKHWMVELLSIACLSIASKFNETFIPSFDELQMEDLKHCFRASTIQQVELMLLQALKWRLGSTTVYSYIELITSNIINLKSNLQKELINQVTNTILTAILDIKLLHYPPSVVAISALWCSLEEIIPLSHTVHLTHIMKLINQDHEEEIIKCHRLMEAWLADHPFYNLKASDDEPSSPVTVLNHIDDCELLHLSLFKMPTSNPNPESSGIKKRKRDEDKKKN